MKPTPRKHTTPRSRHAKVGPGGSFRDWAALETQSFWATPPRSGQRTDVRTGKRLSDIAKGAAIKLDLGFSYLDLDMVKEALGVNDPPLDPLAAPARAAAPSQAPAAPQPAPEPSLAESPAASFVAEQPAATPPAAPQTPEKPPGKRVGSLLDPNTPRPNANAVDLTGKSPIDSKGWGSALRQTGYIPGEQDQPNGWWDWLMRWLGNLFSPITGNPTTADENLANRQAYYHSGKEIKYDKNQLAYRDQDTLLRALNPDLANMDPTSRRLYDASGKFTPYEGFQRGDATDVGSGWWDKWKRALIPGSDWDKSLKKRVAFEDMAKARGQQAGLSQWYGMDRDTAEYSPEAQNYVGNTMFGYDENGNMISDPGAQRSMMAKLVAMTEDTGRIVTPENVGTVAGVEMDVNGQWVDPRQARATHAANHAAQMGYSSVKEMYADGYRMGPNGSIMYPEHFKDQIGKRLFDRTEEIINQQGADPNTAREIARQSLMMEGVYIPSAETAAQEQFAVSRRADEYRRSGVDEARAYELAEREVPRSAYTDLELYDWYAGGSAARADTARSDAALMRNIAAGTLNNYQTYTPSGFGATAEDAALGLVNGLTQGFGGTMLNRYRLFSELKARRPDLSDEEISRWAATASRSETRGHGGKTWLGNAANIAGTFLPMGVIGGAMGGAGSLLSKAPGVARALNAVGKIPGSGVLKYIYENPGKMFGLQLGAPVLGALSGSKPVADTITKALETAYMFTPFGMLQAMPQAVNMLTSSGLSETQARDTLTRAMNNAMGIKNPEARKRVLSDSLATVVPDAADRARIVDSMSRRETTPHRFMGDKRWLPNERSGIWPFGSDVGSLLESYRNSGNAGAEQEITPELLQQLVDSGQLDLEQAQAILNQMGE